MHFRKTAGALLLAIGKGDGTFVPAVLSTPNVDGPGAIAIADLNGDGKNDLVFLTSSVIQDVYSTNEVALMLGNGDGTFGPQALFPVQVASPGSVVDDADSAPGALAVGDMNGDGIPDIVTNGITILFGDGKGGFPNRKDFLNTAGESVILTDFDGDGKMDVVIGIGNPSALSRVQIAPLSYSDTLTVFFGDGNGGLAAAPLAPLPTPNPMPTTADNISLASGDFNKDGIADLAVVRSFQSLSVFLGSTAGILTPAFTYDFSVVAKDASPTSIVAADFNQDGILDLAVSVARSSSPGAIMVFLGVGDGTFFPPISTSTPSYLPALVVGDFNQDGRPDLAAIDGSGSPDAYQVDIFLGHGDGTFALSKNYAAGMLASSLAIGDFNLDGIQDIAFANYTDIRLLLGKSDGTFSPGIDIPFPGANPGPLAAADFNGDGKPDLVSGATILLGHGDGTFDPPVTYPNGSPLVTYPDGSSPASGVGSVAVADIDGDGIPDIFLDTENVLIGNGDGTFHLETTGLASMFSPVVAADFNGDGKLDIAGGFSMSGLGLDSSDQPFRRAVAVFLNLSHPARQLELVSAADFSYGPMAAHSIVSAFGKHLALTTASASPPALPTTLGGCSVSVEDQTGAVSQAQIYYASPEQVNFVLPADLEAGSAIVTIATPDGQSASTEIQIATVAPKLFVVNSNGVPAGYVVRVGAGNVQTIEPIFTEQSGHIAETPIDVTKGQVYLILFGTGFDLPPNANVQIGGGVNSTNTTAAYAGPQGQFPGLDQIDILLPKSLAGSGVTGVYGFLNQVYVTIK